MALPHTILGHCTVKLTLTEVGRQGKHGSVFLFYKSNVSTRKLQEIIQVKFKILEN